MFIKNFIIVSVVALCANASPLIKREVGEECVSGSFECANGGVNVCNHNEWINIAVCDEGTTCVDDIYQCVQNDRLEQIINQIHDDTFQASSPEEDCSDCGHDEETVTETVTCTTTVTCTETETLMETTIKFLTEFATVTDVSTITDVSTTSEFLTVTETETATETETFENTVTTTDFETLTSTATETFTTTDLIVGTVTETETETVTSTLLGSAPSPTTSEHCDHCD